MAVRSVCWGIIASCAAAAAWLSSPPALAAPAEAATGFTPPLAAARTIQVTEVIWEAANGPTPGPLHRTGTITFRIERPDKFRMDFRQDSASLPATYTVSDGTTLVSSDGKQRHTQQTARAEWPFPLMGLLNNTPGPVSATSAVRDKKDILLVVQTNGPGRSEFWFDPKTHLLVQWTMFMTWQGKTSEMMRTEYAGWVLNKPIAPAVFRVPSVGAGHN